MQTLKTAVVVVLLLAVLYGFYIVLSKPEAQHAAGELARELAPPRIEPEFGAPPPTLSFEEAGSPDGGPTAAANSPNTSSPTSVVPGRHPVHPPQDPPAAAAFPSPPPHASSPAGQFARFDPPQPGADANGPGDYPTPDLPVDVQPPHAAPPIDAHADAAHPSVAPASAQTAGRVTQLGELAFAKARRTALTHIEEGRYRDALYTLSIFYNSEDLTPDEHRQLLDLLDPLAGRVIYSTEHLLEPPYRVGREETLVDIARRYNVPYQLLQNINGVRDPQVLVPGTELKVISGPFRAEVDVTRQELTAFVGRYYAGRFPITVGSDPPPMDGTFQVRDKRTDRAYFGGGGTLQPGDPRNPYGNVWMDLGQEMCIHGSAEDYSPRTAGLGCISLSPGDARDVFGILSIGSKVTVRR